MITYPARPISGGRLDLAPPKRGDWAVEPKFIGWRVLVHAPTGTAYNRHGKPLSIAGDFRLALIALKAVWETAPTLEWIDCEGLERRHGIGRGALIILDAVTEGTYDERRTLLQSWFEVLHHDKPPRQDAVLLTPSYPMSDAQSIYDLLLRRNFLWNTPFYEGVVMKQRNSHYPIQTRSPDETTPHWIKHRWR
jgi:ATP-dependent DNA ligase